MDYLQLAAPPPLDAIVRCFWFLRGDEADARPQPVVADGRLDIVLHCAEPFSRIDGDGIARRQGDALLAGQLTGPIRLLQAGSSDVVGIRLRTAAAASLFAEPLDQLTDRVEPLGMLHPRLRDSLLSAANGRRTPEERRDALALALSRFVLRSPDPLTMAAVEALDRPRPPRLDMLARRLGTSVRSIERRVGQATGLAPRQLVRTLRFRRAFGRLERAEAGTLTRVALSAGYYDQAHCVREFRRFAGASPTEFFGQEPQLASALLETLPS